MMASAMMIAATISPSSKTSTTPCTTRRRNRTGLSGSSGRFKGGPQFGAGDNVVAVQDADVLGFPSHL